MQEEALATLPRSPPVSSRVGAGAAAQPPPADLAPLAAVEALVRAARRASLDVEQPGPARDAAREATGEATGEGRAREEVEAALPWLEAFANERYYPLVGWSANLLPTDPPAVSDRLAQVDLRSLVAADDAAGGQLPAGWAWSWVDAEWSVGAARYAIDFGEFRAGGAGSAEPGALSMVRRRSLRRRRVMVREGAPEPTGVAEPGVAEPGAAEAALYKRALAAYARESSAMLAERDGKIAELRRKLRASEERCQSLLVTARNAIMSGAAARNEALAELDRCMGASAPQRHYSSLEHRRTSYVTALNQQFSQREIDIDSYALALAGLADADGEGEGGGPEPLVDCVPSTAF
jgi:hypothetical protein